MTITKKRATKETDIELTLTLQGSGKAAIDTGIGFFDHMLDAFARHSYIDLDLVCKGDLHVDDHHSVEDVAIVLAQALGEAIYPAKSIERYGNSVVVMDEAAVACDLDFSNRAYLHFDLPIGGKVGSFDVELVEEFFRAFAMNMPLTLHLVMQRGKNRHHIIEAAFKALAVAFRRAAAQNNSGVVPSTKGVL